MLCGHGADHDVAAVSVHALEIADAPEIDQMSGGREPQFHHWNETVAAGQRARLLAKIGKQGDGFRD